MRQIQDSSSEYTPEELREYLEWLSKWIELYEEAKWIIKLVLIDHKNLWNWIWRLSHWELVKMLEDVDYREVCDWLWIAIQLMQCFLIDEEYVRVISNYMSYENVLRNKKMLRLIKKNPTIVDVSSIKIKAIIEWILDME